MTYQVVWSDRALNQAAGFLEDDPAGLTQLLDAVDLLADEPRPSGSAEYGSPDVRRLHVGRYRILYDIDDTTVTVVVIHAGRLG